MILFILPCHLPAIVGYYEEPLSLEAWNRQTYHGISDPWVIKIELLKIQVLFPVLHAAKEQDVCVNRVPIFA